MRGKKKPAKKKVTRKGSGPAAEAGAVAKRAPRTSVGQDVVVGDEDLEEEEEEDEVVAEGNRPAEIVKRARCNFLFQLPPRPRGATMFLGSVSPLVPPQAEF